MLHMLKFINNYNIKLKINRKSAQMDSVQDRMKRIKSEELI
jgi:hypothetical protein